MSTSPQGDALKLQPAEGLKGQQDALEPLQTLRTKSLEVNSERFADYPCGGRGAHFHDAEWQRKCVGGVCGRLCLLSLRSRGITIEFETGCWFTSQWQSMPRERKVVQASCSVARLQLYKCRAGFGLSRPTSFSEEIAASMAHPEEAQ